jgi:hypothetical protein
VFIGALAAGLIAGVAVESSAIAGQIVCPGRGPVAARCRSIREARAMRLRLERRFPKQAPTTSPAPSTSTPAAPKSPATSAPTTTPPTTTTPPSTTTPTTQPSATTRQVPASIDSTGTNDVTAALLAFFAGVPDGSTIVFPANGRYRIEDALILNGRNNLTFEGNGSLFFATTPGYRTRYHWAFGGGSGITIRNVVVKGANPYAGTGDLAYNGAYEAQHGFTFNGVNGVLLDHVTVTDVYGDFVYLGKSGPWTSNVVIRNSRFERNGRMGFGITAAQDVVIENNTMDQMRRAAFDFEPNAADWGARRITIRNNDIGDHRLMTIASTGTAPFDDITFTGNRLTKMGVIVTVPDGALVRRHNLTFTNNVITGYSTKTTPTLSVANTDGLTVTGNVYDFRIATAAPVMTYWSCGVTAHDNNWGSAVLQWRNETSFWTGCG